MTSLRRVIPDPRDRLEQTPIELCQIVAEPGGPRRSRSTDLRFLGGIEHALNLREGDEFIVRGLDGRDGRWADAVHDRGRAERRLVRERVGQ